MTGAERNSQAARKIMPLNLRRKNYMRLLRGFDLNLVSVTFIAALALSSRSWAWPDLANILVMRIKLVNLLLFLGFLMYASTVFKQACFYESHRLSDWRRRFREVLFASTALTAAFLILGWPLNLSFVDNKFLSAFWLISTLVLLVRHDLGQRFLYVIRSQGRNLRNLVVVGKGKEALELAERLTREAGLGYRIVAVIDGKEAKKRERVASHF